MKLEWWFTHLGDLFVASCMALAIGLWCWVNLGRMIAVAYWVCFGGAFGLATLIKLWTSRHLPEPYDVPLWAPSAGAPSGHTALAMVVYGGAAAIFLKATRGRTTALGALGSILALIMVATTRVTLHTHTVADVVCGVAVSLGFLWIFVRVLDAQAPAPAPAPRPSMLISIMFVVAAAAGFSHIRLSSDQFL